MSTLTEEKKPGKNNVFTKLMYKVDTVKINLRSKKKIHMKKDFTSKTKILNSPLYRGIKLWDSLPGDIQKEKDFRNFKKTLLTHTFK